MGGGGGASPKRRGRLLSRRAPPLPPAAALQTPPWRCGRCTSAGGTRSFPSRSARTPRWGSSPGSSRTRRMAGYGGPLRAHLGVTKLASVPNQELLATIGVVQGARFADAAAQGRGGQAGALARPEPARRRQRRRGWRAARGVEAPRWRALMRRMGNSAQTARAGEPGSGRPAWSEPERWLCGRRRGVRTGRVGAHPGRGVAQARGLPEALGDGPEGSGATCATARTNRRRSSSAWRTSRPSSWRGRGRCAAQTQLKKREDVEKWTPSLPRDAREIGGEASTRGLMRRHKHVRTIVCVL